MSNKKNTLKVYLPMTNEVKLQILKHKILLFFTYLENHRKEIKINSKENDGIIIIKIFNKLHSPVYNFRIIFKCCHHQ